MNTRRILTGTSLVLAIGLSAGCASTDGNMSNSVYATHRIVKNIEEDIGPNVAKLNETAAELVAKVEASDQENRQLRAVIEENQAKIDRLQQQVTSLTTVLYRQMGLTPAQTGVATPSRPAEVLPPTTVPSTQPMTTQPVPPSTVQPVEPQGGSLINQPVATTPPPPTQVTQPPTEMIAPQTTAPAASSETAEIDYISAQKAFIDENYDDALRLYTEYLSRYPDGASAHNAQFWKAECYRRLEQHENAIREFEYLEQRYGNTSDASKLPLAMKNRAEAHIALGQTAIAAEILRELIEKYPMTGVVDGAKSRLRTIEGE